MPLQSVRLTWDQITGEPHDRVVWSWGFDGPLFDNASLLDFWTTGGAGGSGLMSTFTNNVVGPPDTMLSILQTGLTTRLLEAFPAQGGAAIAVVPVIGDLVAAGGVDTPAEVQLVLTRYGTTPRGEAPVGRLYVGPIDADAGRPGATETNRVLYWALDVRSEFAAFGGDEVVIRGQGTPGASGEPITEFAVDNAWDTQRRRGWEPTARVFANDLP